MAEWQGGLVGGVVAGLGAGLVAGVVVFIIGLLLPRASVPTAASRSRSFVNLPTSGRRLGWRHFAKCGCEVDRRGRKITN